MNRKIQTTIDINDIAFHANRYLSARKLYDAIDNGHITEKAVIVAYIATASDGGNIGTIPCLGGCALDEWKRLCEYVRVFERAHHAARAFGANEKSTNPNWYLRYVVCQLNQL